MTIPINGLVPILKVDRRLGIAFGFAMVCKEVKDGEVQDYYDLHGDHVPEDVMIEAASAYAMADRMGKAEHGRTEQHGHAKVADVVFIFPLTVDVAKSLGIQTDRFGLLIGYKPTEKSVLDDIEKGVYAGFSFGGLGVRTEVQP